MTLTADTATQTASSIKGMIVLFITIVDYLLFIDATMVCIITSKDKKISKIGINTRKMVFLHFIDIL